jgi:hypothetical protein
MGSAEMADVSIAVSSDTQAAIRNGAANQPFGLTAFRPATGGRSS